MEGKTISCPKVELDECFKLDTEETFEFKNREESSGKVNQDDSVIIQKNIIFLVFLKIFKNVVNYYCITNLLIS